MDRRLSLLTPSGHLTLGNLLGALRPMAAGQQDADCFYGIADLHAMTTPHDPGRLRTLVAGDGDADARRRSRRGHAVRAEPGTGPRASWPTCSSAPPPPAS